MIQNFYCDVGAGHQLWVMFAGNPQGIPVLFLHGGPGAGCKLDHFAYFDLDRYWVVLFDQRGSGRSQPYGELNANTSQDLIADIERLRVLFGVERWLLFGGSWGSFLALSYAVHHPDRVAALVLRSICLGRQQEHDWLYCFGANQLFPQAWQNFCDFIATEERNDLLSAYYRCLMSVDPQLQWQAAWRWSSWAMACLELPAIEEPQIAAERQRWIAQVRIEVHYFFHQLFFPPHHIFNALPGLNAIPTAIVHGTHDFLCPVDNAVSLQRLLPLSHLTLVPQAGHLSSAPGMFAALQQALLQVTDK